MLDVKLVNIVFWLDFLWI